MGRKASNTTSRAAASTRGVSLGLPYVEVQLCAWGLGCLVFARGSLKQSKPSIEATKANTGQGGCNSNTGMSAGRPRMAWRTEDSAAMTPTGTYPSLRPRNHPTPRYVARNRRKTVMFAIGRGPGRRRPRAE